MKGKSKYPISKTDLNTQKSNITTRAEINQCVYFLDQRCQDLDLPKLRFLLDSYSHYVHMDQPHYKFLFLETSNCKEAGW